MKWTAKNLSDLEKIAENVLEMARKMATENNEAVVLALHGNLGAGKTTFTKSLAKILGITESVTSPTFVIQKNFDIPADNGFDATPFEKLIHIDTYRIDLEDELAHLGWHDNLLRASNLISVEWPENIPNLLPENTISIYFDHVDETTRTVEIKK